MGKEKEKRERKKNSRYNKERKNTGKVENKIQEKKGRKKLGNCGSKRRGEKNMEGRQQKKLWREKNEIENCVDREYREQNRTEKKMDGMDEV